MTATAETLRRTPLYDAHLAAGARLVPFGGWEMPVQYGGIPQEHRAVRHAAGLFDISHMGEFLVTGHGAETTLNHLLTNDVSRLAPGQAQYTLLCQESGGIIDDLIVYRLTPDTFLLVVNAANTATDLAWIQAHAGANTTVDDQSQQTAALALQGPRAAAILPEAESLDSFAVADLDLDGIPTRVARTGYTGEDGFEILVDSTRALDTWELLFKRGTTHGLLPCGLGARDVLRLEMAYPLHGNDITDQTTPLEAGLGRFVSLDKDPPFIGQPTMVRQKTEGLSRRLAAFRMTSKSPPPRPHYPIIVSDQTCGEVTSGGPSPALGTGIGLGYLPPDQTTIGNAVEIEIRGRRFPAEIVAKPFYRRAT